MKLIIKIIIVFIVALSILLLYKELTSGRTRPIRDEKGQVISDSIAVLEKIELGGIEQWILIRGRSIANPILLWLHGGPGAAQMPTAYRFNSVLEDEFIVVHWDQRGAGKSNSPEFDEKTMTVQQFINDTRELTEYLTTRFGQDKIYLAGHSWGSQIGILTVYNHPEHYYAYIGISQLVDPREAQKLAYPWLEEQIELNNNKKDRQTLEKLGQPYYSAHSDYVTFAGLIDNYGGNMDIGMGKLALVALKSPEYRLRDYYAWLQGATRGSGPMWEESQAFNAFEDVPSLNVPVYFFSGEKDRNTPLELVHRYFSLIDAQEGKEIVIFENSAHTPYMAEPDKFNRELIRVKKEIRTY